MNNNFENASYHIGRKIEKIRVLRGTFRRYPQRVQPNFLASLNGTGKILIDQFFRPLQSFL